MDGTHKTGEGTGAVLDPNVIASLRELGGEDDPGLLLELIGLFLEDAPQRLKDIETALATGELKLLERAAHTLKSSSASIGAMQLSGLCKRIEETARRRSTEEIPALLRDCNGTLAEVESALRSLPR